MEQWGNYQKIFTGLGNGNYTVTVTNTFGCTLTNSYSITGPASITINSATVNETCGKVNGSMNLIVTGGISPYTYLWSNGKTTSQITGLSSANYTVTITDNNLCATSATIFVAQTSGPSISNVVGNNLTCNGSNNGSINLTVLGGTLPYTFLLE